MLVGSYGCSSFDNHLPEGLWLRQEPPQTAPMLGLPLEAKIGTAKTSFRLNCDEGFFFLFFFFLIKLTCCGMCKSQRVVLLSHLKYDPESHSVICLIRLICVWINFLLEEGAS